jgi:plasmid stabilization system protein ParE
MNYHFLPDAKAELNNHMDYYENVKPGLGGDFHGKVISALAKIIDNPEMWPKASRRTRRCLTDRFPYSVIYHYNEKQEHIAIVAIAHNKQ